ncbi:dihydroorotase [Selenomonas sp.]|uniref:dihydroorotase n=1 Tax=Selenomonas sp. TaxID=2053611 RepID=UPI003FA2B7C2
MKQIFKGGRIVDPKNGVDEKADILVENGVVREVASHIMDENAEIIDVSGKVIVPGLIDMHTHLREPGQEAKEDFLSGSQAAAAGGFTTVATMPNTSPVVDTAALVRSLQARAEEVGIVHIEIIGALTKGQKGEELAEIGDMSLAGAVAFSDDGHYVKSAKIMMNGMDYLRNFDKIIIDHDEELSLIEEGVMNEGHRSAMLGMKGRPTVAEDIAVARDILLAEYVDAPVHVAHISSARAADLVREGKRRGVKVTAEVTPHHLILTDDCVQLTDSSTKVNPPLRGQKDADAMLEALKDGTIDIIVSDHSPHAAEEKDREYMYAPSGFPGLETTLGLLLTELYHKGKMDLPALIAKMTSAPAALFHLNAGSLEAGMPADITVIDLDKEWVVDAEQFYTRGTHSPYVGYRLKGKAVMTVVDGRIVMRDGKVLAREEENVG